MGNTGNRQTGTANAADIQNSKQTSDTTPSTAIEGKPPSASPSPVNQTNSSSNTPPKKAHVIDEQEEESATTDSIEDSSSSGPSSAQKAGEGMTDANNTSNSNTGRGSADTQNEPYPGINVFDEAYRVDFLPGGGSNVIEQTGDGQGAVEGFNRAHHMNFENFSFAATGAVDTTGGSGVAMKHFGKAHDMKFKGVKLEFIGGKMVQTPISNAAPQPTGAAPNYQAQPNGYNQGYHQPPNMYPGPQANGWNNGPAIRDAWGGPPPVQVTQSITAYAAYEAQMPGNRQQIYPGGGQWYPQYAYAEQTMRPGQDAQYGNPPPNMNYGPPPPWNQYRQGYR